MPDPVNLRDLESTVFHMIGRNGELPDILRILCRAYGSENGQLAFLLPSDGGWKVAATGDLTPEDCVELAGTSLLLAAPAPKESPQARFLYSEIGEMLGLVVILGRRTRPTAGRTETLDSLCRLAILSMEQRNLLDELLWRAEHDSLTGLFTRTYFERLIAWRLEQRNGQGEVSLLCLNLDRFRLVNEVLGHSLGNRVLEAVGQRLKSCVPSDTPLARLGGDEFAVLTEPGEAV